MYSGAAKLLGLAIKFECRLVHDVGKEQDLCTRRGLLPVRLDRNSYGDDCTTIADSCDARARRIVVATRMANPDASTN